MSDASIPSSEAAEQIEREVMGRLAPDPATLARVERARATLVERAEQEAKRLALPLHRTVVAGSAARGTFLPDRLDIDLFFLFPPSVDRATLERVGLELGQAVLTETEVRYAEHPYLRGRFEGFAVDAVPGYAVPDPSRPMSAVDRTPFHQEYLIAHLTPELIGQVRLTKQFLRSRGLYGSEARTAGFSGYLVELLVLRLGGFRPLLMTAREWRVPVTLMTTPGARPRVPDDVALVLDDPVDPHRNVASALSRRNLAIFILAAQDYLAHPSGAAFELQAAPSVGVEEAVRRVHQRATHVVALELARPSLVDDILYPQLRKAERAVASEAAHQGFQPLATASAAGTGRLVVLLEVAHDRVPAVRQQDGPPPGVDRVGDFLSKWTRQGAEVLQGPYVQEDGRLAVETVREHREIAAILREALPRLAIGRDLRAALDESATVRPLNEVTETPQLRQALGGLLEKRLPFGRRPA